jgi:hypothetical protein
MDEPKMRGAPKGEISRAPILRKEQLKEPKSEPKPHNAMEEVLMAQPATQQDPAAKPEQRRVAVITGASSGIGKAVALHLASSNYNVVLVARKKPELHQVEQELAKYSVKVLTKECDVTKVKEVHDAVQHALKLFGRIDVLVNCAGFGVYGPIDTMRLEDINNQMLTNYFGTVLFIKECLAALKEHKGAIINVASLAGMVGVPKMAAYSASKFAVYGLSESLRMEFEDTGVSVSCICPGKVRTNFFSHASFKDVAYAAESDGIVPSAVARVIDRAIKERKFLYVLPKSKRLELAIARLLPESYLIKRVKQNMRQS